MRYSNLLGIGLLVILSAVADGAPQRPLDLMLNPIQLDAYTQTRDTDNDIETSPELPVGQTFVTGDNVDTVYRIAIWQAFWHETWDADEILVMTLWDSPERNTAVGRAIIPYRSRMWEQAVPMFTLDARVAPSTEYYFELTVEIEPQRPAETPREWLMEGERPGIAGGDGVLGGIGIAQDNYEPGNAFIGGEPQEFDLWFQVHSRHARSRDAIYEDAFDYLDLDYPPLSAVREAVDAKAWDDAITELVAYFESLDEYEELRWTPEHNPDFDTTHADLAVEMQVALEDGTNVYLEPDWNHYALWPERGGVGLTRTGIRGHLAHGYINTGNPRYARGFNDMLESFFINSPSPIRAGAYERGSEVPAALPAAIYGGTMWSGLSIGARMGHAFYFYGFFDESPFFTEDVRAAFIFNLGEMAEMLDHMRGGGNWETQMADALFNFGKNYPEFSGAVERMKLGLDTLVDNAMRTVLPDGVLHETAIGYHLLVLNRYSQLLQRAEYLELELPQEFIERTEKDVRVCHGLGYARWLCACMGRFKSSAHSGPT